jgi:hypothetical protein
MSSDDPEVVVPATVSGWEHTPESTTLFVPAAPPDGWTIAGIDTMPFQDDFDGPTTSQLFAVAGQPPLGRGVVLTSGVAPDHDFGESNGAVRGHPANIGGRGGPGDPGPGRTVWVEDGALHEAVAVGLTEDQVLDFLASLVPHDDPATGFAVPAASTLPELDHVNAATPSAATVRYRGPHDQVMSVTAESPGAGTLIARLEGEPRGDELVVRDDATDFPIVTVTRADGWSVTSTIEEGTPDPALLDAFLVDVRPFTMEQLVDAGMTGPATTVVTVGGETVEVHGNDGTDLAVCVTPKHGGSVCAGVAAQPEYDFTSASLAVGDRWIVVAVSDVRDGDDPGQVITQTGHAGDDPLDPEPGELLHGERGASGDRTIEVVTVPDGVRAVTAQSPMTDAGSVGVGYFRPG